MKLSLIYIQDRIIDKCEVHFLTDINRYYQSLLHELGGDEFKDAAPSAQKLEDKLQIHYKDKIKFEKGVTKRGNMMFNPLMSVEEAIRKQNNRSTSLNMQIQNAAFALREAIMNAKTK